MSALLKNKNTQKRAFRVKPNISKKLNKRKKKIAKRTRKRNWENQPKPMLTCPNIYYDVDDRNRGIANGGIGIIHQLVKKTGLAVEIDHHLELLKRYIPYHESDHVLNLAYNILSGGHCLQDIEFLRKDDGWLDALGAEIIPAPTTAGDFLRRFTEDDVIQLMEVKNTIRKKLWQEQPKIFSKQAIINVDGTISPICGKCKEGMDISYDGKWGYHPLVISLANTREPLYIINRSGNAPSHLNSAVWLDKSLDLVRPIFEKVWIRGDTDFSLTKNFDKWDQLSNFIFGMDGKDNLVRIADEIAADDWKILEKKRKYTAKTTPRKRPEKVKDQVVKRRKFRCVHTQAEHIAEFLYQPWECSKNYRMIVLRKTLKVTKGDQQLEEKIRYFFYITNEMQMGAKQLVQFYRDRADHENDIEQLKNGVRALHSPSDSLISNWAYMVIASLAWDLKAWYGMLMPYRHLGLSILRMEFKRFTNIFIRIPCLIIKTGRQICYRIVGYNNKVKHALNLFKLLKTFAFK
jgi:hypothetical protein